ncbi:MAG TPA: rRNA maturation RNase YbeY [Bacillota bacterium]|jgi:probable rRNA maturation factor
MEVLISNLQDKVPVDERLEGLVRSTVEAGLTEELSPARRDQVEVSVALVDDEHIHQLNKEYRQIDCATDVLSFAMLEGADEDRPLLLGDIVVSLERARDQAETYGHTFEREVAFLTLHGLLHLLGHDHHTDEQEREMDERQEAVLRRLGLAR